MPKMLKEWEQSPLWGVFVDGKDAADPRSPHIYDWDRNFFQKVSKTLSTVYANEENNVGKKDLTIDQIERYRTMSYSDLEYGQPGDFAAREIMPDCTDKMDCKDVLSLLVHIPKTLYTSSHGDKSCPRGLMAAPYEDKKSMLKHILEHYNKKINKVKGETQAEKEQLLDALVAFTRSFAFLHPYANGNGRLRNILLQREIRRLGLGCGTMMYNNNKDAFVDGHDRQVGKVREGIRMFNEAVKTDKNPWISPETIKMHKVNFQTLNGLERCAQKKRMGSGGTINLKQVQEEMRQEEIKN